jgi:hypothetical protein
MYCQLLKMVLIHLQSPSGNIDQKTREFAQFLDEELATMYGREMVVARSYFGSGQKLKFFGKMQKKQEDLFDVLNGMAWDLWHVRQLEENMTFRPSTGVRYFFPAILTFDKRLIEIMDLYPLKSCAFIEGKNEPMPFFDGDFFQAIAETPDTQQEFIQRFYSTEACASRSARRSNANAKRGEIVKALEEELSKVTEVQKPSK